MTLIVPEYVLAQQQAKKQAEKDEAEAKKKAEKEEAAAKEAEELALAEAEAEVRRLLCNRTHVPVLWELRMHDCSERRLYHLHSSD